VDLSFLNDAHAWEQLAPAWNDLLARSATDVPFLRFEFLHAWWSTLGGGEWPDGTLVVAVAHDDGRLQAALPFFRTSARPGSLLIIGTAEVADYLDLVAPSAHLGAFAAGLLDAVARGTAGVVEQIDLWNIIEGSPGGRVLAEAAGQAGWSVERARLKACPQIQLEGGWDGYLARLAKKQRHELRRKMRRVEQTAGAGYVRAGREIGLAEATEAFLRLMAFDAAKNRFLTPAMQAMFQTLVRDAGQSGWLRLEFLMVDGRPAAGALCFDYGDRLYLYNSGLDPAQAALSPGWALVGHLIQSAAEEGKATVDFMRGDEEYKIRLGGEPRYVERIILRVPSR
jgi:CelD/BcsL family acetyltransferase involved in cellulose biosynthesis